MLEKLESCGTKKPPKKEEFRTRAQAKRPRKPTPIEDEREELEDWLERESSDVENVLDRPVETVESFFKKETVKELSKEERDAKEAYDIKESYDVHSLSKLVKRSECRIQKWAKEGKIPARKVGVKWLFPKEEIDRWLFERKHCEGGGSTADISGADVAPAREAAPKQDKVTPPEKVDDGVAQTFYDVRFLSNLLGKSERRIQEWAKEGKVPARKVGERWQFLKEEIDRWLSERENCADIVPATNTRSTGAVPTMETASGEKMSFLRIRMTPDLRDQKILKRQGERELLCMLTVHEIYINLMRILHTKDSNIANAAYTAQISPQTVGCRSLKREGKIPLDIPLVLCISS